MKPLDEIGLFKYEKLIRIIVYLAHIFLFRSKNTHVV